MVRKLRIEIGGAAFPLPNPPPAGEGVQNPPPKGEGRKGEGREGDGD